MLAFFQERLLDPYGRTSCNAKEFWRGCAAGRGAHPTSKRAYSRHNWPRVASQEGNLGGALRDVVPVDFKGSHAACTVRWSQKAARWFHRAKATCVFMQGVKNVVVPAAHSGMLLRAAR